VGYTKESLERLRERVDLVEVLASHLKMQRSGAAYKALCPFHEEKTPSFIVQRGDSHYHCFGCGAHGDAIAFLMGFLKLSFKDAVEQLAERFQVLLERSDERESRRGPGKAVLRDALAKACQFYHFSLLHTEEGHAALHYLYRRGISLAFVQKFEIGFALKTGGVFQNYMREAGIDDETLVQAGLLSLGSRGQKRDFFSDRITFPIRDAAGAVIGFSARKFKEETYGGKYVNTPETPLFKKSQVLFGLNYSRRRIAKERKALVVEGQIDALRLIDAGMDWAVAGQGTAFGEGQVKELLHLGVAHVYLAFDGDAAGQEAAVKVGDLFQKQGVEVSVVPLPEGCDPDALLQEEGCAGLTQRIDASTDYLTFLFHRLAQRTDLSSPSKKSALVQAIASRVRAWEQPVMVHESLRKLASLAHVPESVLGAGQDTVAQILVKRSGTLSPAQVDPDRVLETDLLRWLLLMGSTLPRLVGIVQANVSEKHFKVESCRCLFVRYMQAHQARHTCDLLSLITDAPEAQELFAEITAKRVNMHKAEEGLIDAVRALLQRRWLEEREEIRKEMQADSENLDLVKRFAALKPPEIIC
jgi:DNA primase